MTNDALPSPSAGPRPGARRPRRVCAWLAAGLLVAGAARADAVRVTQVRVWPAPDHTRVVFDLSGPLSPNVFNLDDPARVVIDLDGARLAAPLPGVASPLLADLRAGRTPKGARVVLDLKTRVETHGFLLKPFEQYGYRFVVDVAPAGAAARAQAPLTPPVRPKDLVIAVDAGHGGDDPGAIGYHGTREKDVALAIARELARQINATPGMKAVLIRKGDYYIGLRDRIEKAYRADADAFVSIHADAMRTRSAHGASVYALSERGATREARYLAARENSADYIGGVSLSEKDDLLNKVLVDMSQAGTMSASLDLAHDILASIRHVGPMHMNHVGQAAFMVLRSPSIPSVLVETAFISNPGDERRLRSRAYQRRLAHGILDGLKRAAPLLYARRGTSPPRAKTAREAARVERAHRGDT